MCIFNCIVLYLWSKNHFVWVSVTLLEFANQAAIMVKGRAHTQAASDTLCKYSREVVMSAITTPGETNR